MSGLRQCQIASLNRPLLPSFDILENRKKARRILVGEEVFFVPAGVEVRLEEIYRQVDAEVSKSNPQCKACGECCDFTSFDHQLWLTHLELWLIVGNRGLRRPQKGGACPYLENGLCSAREFRALGCRIFSCEAGLEASQDLHERFLKNIRSLAQEFGIDLYYGELLTSLREIEIPSL